jgi:O-antigen ligase
MNRSASTRGYSGRRTAFVAVVVLWTAVGEEFNEGGWRAWFGNEIMSVPSHYLYLAATVVLLSPYLLAMPRWSLTGALRRLRIWPWISLGWVAVVVALSLAILTAAPNPFADWRNLVVTGLVAGLAGRWLAAQPWARKALVDLAIGYGLVAAFHLVLFAAGGGTSVLGVRTPIFYGALLYMTVFASVTLVYVWTTATSDMHSPVEGHLIRVGAISSTLLVILSFRRSFWMALAVGMVGVGYLWFRSRSKNPKGVLTLGLLMAAGLIVALSSIGTENIATRLESFLPGADNEFTATNEDHVNDMIDAWRVISAEPLLGYGIGRVYPTELIAAWKAESFEVHNAVLHVWLKYGILGAVAYLGFHLKWIRVAWTSGRLDEGGSAVLAALAIYMGAEFMATMVGTWPYGSTHMSVFHGVLLACTAVTAVQKTRPAAQQPAATRFSAA